MIVAPVPDISTSSEVDNDEGRILVQLNPRQLYVGVRKCAPTNENFLENGINVFMEPNSLALADEHVSSNTAYVPVITTDLSCTVIRSLPKDVSSIGFGNRFTEGPRSELGIRNSPII